MEQGNLLSARQHALSSDWVRRCLAARQPPGRRVSPQSTAEVAKSSGSQDGRPHGDHDLNPDLYEPCRALTPAAVLVPIVEREGGLTLLFTRRSDHLHHHPGQISFPGGRLDPGDASPEAAALREAEEEVGLGSTDVRLLGRLDTYVTRTGFEVVPVVGLVQARFAVAADAFEVAEVFEVPLGFFLDPANCRTQARLFEGKERRFYVYTYQAHNIWGATAGMLVNLAEVLSEQC